MDFHTLVDHTLWSTLQWSARIAEVGWHERPAGLLSHIVLGEGMWLDRIERRRLNGAIFTVLVQNELEDAARRQADQAHRLLRDRETKRIAYTRLSGESGEASVAEIIVHTITHGFHHRGQIASWFAQQQLPYPTVDLIQFLRMRTATV